MFQTLLIAAIPKIIEEVIARMSANPDVPLNATPMASRQVAAEVVREVRNLPEIQHVTSTETHWWEQRSKWSAIVAGLTPLVALAGWEMTPEHQESVVTVVMVIGNSVAAYLAYRAGTATRPLGAGKRRTKAA